MSGSHGRISLDNRKDRSEFYGGYLRGALQLLRICRAQRREYFFGSTVSREKRTQLLQLPEYRFQDIERF